MALFNRLSWFRVWTVTTVLLSSRPLNSKHIYFLKAFMWKYLYRLSYIISLLPLLGCHFFVLLWFPLNFERSSLGISVLEIAMATLRKMHTAGSRLRGSYPARALMISGLLGLLGELQEGHSRQMRAACTLPIKNVSCVI